jgi:hypothetical protein
MRVPGTRSARVAVPLLAALASALAACGSRLETATSGDMIDMYELQLGGSYNGPEFVSEAEAKRLGIKGTDVAHQFSNRMSEAVAETLREHAAAGRPIRADLQKIRLETKDMNRVGDVMYTITVPFVEVPRAQAATHFDHRGGWGHEGEDVDAWRKRLRERYGVEPECSPTMRTPEGLVETWCQWGDAPTDRTARP